MKKTVVSIVSEQTIPNVVFIKEMPAADRYLFITTPKMEEKGITDNIIKVCQIPVHQTSKVPVLENSFQNIAGRLEELKLTTTNDAEYLVNITGGTKPMSIVVYNFFKQLNSRIYYMPLGSNGFMLCNSTTEITEPVVCELTLSQYLKAYGFEIANETEMNQLTAPPEYTNMVFQNQLLNNPEMVALHRYVTEFTKTNHKQPGNLSLTNPPPELVFLPGFLYFTIKFPLQNKNTVSRSELHYLTGGWFREYLYSRLKEKHNLHNSNIGIGVKLVRNSIAIEPHLVYVLKNSLFMGFCVTAPKKTELENTIYRLSGYKKGRNIGLQSKGFIAIDETYRDKAGNIKFDLTNRAQLQDITIFDRLNLNML